METDMKILIPLTFASILLTAGCVSVPQESVAAQSPTAHSYVCQSGETIAATYPSTDTATIRYKGNTYNMQIAVSASGARYVGGELQWWTKGSGAGSEGTLFRHLADGTSGQIIESCTES